MEFNGLKYTSKNSIFDIFQGVVFEGHSLTYGKIEKCPVCSSETSQIVEIFKEQFGLKKYPNLHNFNLNPPESMSSINRRHLELQL